MSKLSNLYQEHVRAVRARCRCILRDAVAAEDATQETFLRVQRHLDDTAAVEDVRAWILRIATNYCLNERRNHASARQRVLQLPYAEGVSTEEGLLARDLLRSFLRDLPEPLRTLVSLHYFLGLPQDHIAGELGVSRRTVVSRMADLRDSLQRFQRTAG